MPGTFLLARRYIAYYRGRTAILVAAITLTIYLPLVTHWAIRQFQEQAMSRARATPLIVGAKGSRFGLAIHALHFRGDPPESITMAEIDRIRASKLATVIPLFARFRAGGYVVVGTTPEYYVFRGLAVSEGESLGRLGDCVLGASVAQQLELHPGDRLLSEPDNLFDLSGPSPLNMRVAGILEPTGTADDDVIFADLKTTWIIQGIGHGHEGASGGDHQHKASRANLAQYAEVTDDNLQTFHFHGTSEEFPLTAIIARPDSEKSEALLMGRYLSPDETKQILKPVEVVDELMEIILQARQLFDLGMILLAAATLLLVGLVMLLSLRLRQREMNTMFRLGCSRTTIFRIQAAELAIALLLSSLLAVVLAWGSMSVSASLFRLWIV
ncbi:MAG: ABC transporter permease [Planctomycetota bacterium]|nr:ABC transporter permease [Planctomycetota bacterium]